jgi:hypothetical protein
MINQYGYGLISYICECQCELNGCCRLKRASSPVHAPVIVASLHAQSVRDGTLHSDSVHPVVHAHAFAW